MPAIETETLQSETLQLAVRRWQQASLTLRVAERGGDPAVIHPSVFELADAHWECMAAMRRTHCDRMAGILARYPLRGLAAIDKALMDFEDGMTTVTLTESGRSVLDAPAEEPNGAGEALGGDEMPVSEPASSDKPALPSW